jgi:hypothetical protein
MKAFPGMDIRAQYEGSWDDKFLVPFTGMDLRDYFAAKAMQAIMTNDTLLIEASEYRDTGSEFSVATLAYEQADAMIKIREIKIESI